jgi:hypothetical protein
MSRACSTNENVEKYTKHLTGKSEGEMPLGILLDDGMVALKEEILKKRVGGSRLY